MKRITLPRPCDFHVHFRYDWRTGLVIPFTVLDFGLAVVEPNTSPPITSVAMAVEYRAHLQGYVPPGCDLRLYMTVYLTDETPAEEVDRMADCPWILGFKLYPANATTGSSHGVTDIRDRYPIFARCEELGVPVTVHGEVTDPSVDIFDREAMFIELVLVEMRLTFPGLLISLEHITTREGVDFVRGHRNTVGTITPQHLALNRNALLEGGLRPHRYCLPILKREGHRRALVKAALDNRPNGVPKFFAGTDSAPHAKNRKEAACGCAGCFNAPVAIPTYTRLFEQSGRYDWQARLADFLAYNGPDAHGLERNRGTIKLVREPWTVPSEIGGIVPLFANEELPWQVVR